MAAEQDAIKKLPLNIAKLPKPEKKAWASKLIPLIKDNKIIATATFLKPQVIAGLRGNLEGKGPPSPGAQGKKEKARGKGASKGKKDVAKEGEQGEGGINVGALASQVAETVGKQFEARLGKLEKTVEAALTGQGNGGPKVITLEEPETELELTGSQAKLALSPLTMMYYSWTVKQAKQRGLVPVGVSDFVNRVVEEFFQTKGYHFIMQTRQEVTFSGETPR